MLRKKSPLFQNFVGLVLIGPPSYDDFSIRINIKISFYCNVQFTAQDIPTFPVIDRLLVSVKERVNIAREIDSLDLRCRRDNTQKGWLKKAAEEMDILLDEDQV